LLASTLRQRRHEVLEARDRSEAISLARWRRIHLLITDVELSGFGLDLAARLQRRQPLIRVMLVSAHVDGIVAPGRDWVFMRMPFPMDAFLTQVDRLLADECPL
jgi:DNA-binding NtrC family response regulator